MTREFTGSAESTATVDRIHAAFASEDYWRDRLTSGGTPAVLDWLNVHSNGSVAVRYTVDVGRQLLPGVVAKLIPGDVTMQYEETWTPHERAVAGAIGVAVSGGLGSCRAAARLMPTAIGSELRFEGRVDVKIPLMGGNLEKAIGADLMKNLPSVLDFTTTWITEND